MTKIVHITPNDAEENKHKCALLKNSPKSAIVVQHPSCGYCQRFAPNLGTINQDIIN